MKMRPATVGRKASGSKKRRVQKPFDYQSLTKSKISTIQHPSERATSASKKKPSIAQAKKKTFKRPKTANIQHLRQPLHQQ